MTDAESAILAAFLIGFAVGSAFGFAAGMARLRDLVARRRSRARYRRVGSSK